jgi:hypothetical protein
VYAKHIKQFTQRQVVGMWIWRMCKDENRGTGENAVVRIGAVHKGVPAKGVPR